MKRYRDPEGTTVLALALKSSSAPSEPVGNVKGRFIKEIARVGTYVKEHDDGTAVRFTITRDVLDHWAFTFRAMRANGVSVSVPSSHAAAGNARENFGFVVEMSRRGDALYATFDLAGDDAILAASRNDVSIYAPPMFKDGKGNVYIRPITHVCLTPEPLIPGLGPWQQIAASLIRKEQKMDWTKIREALGIEAELTDDNAEALILQAIEALKHPVIQEPVAPPPPPAPVAAPAPEPAPAVAASANASGDPVLLSLVADNRRGKLDALVAAERITPALKEKLAVKYCDPSTLALALSRGGDGFETLVEVMASLAPMNLGERTGAQILDVHKQPTASDPVGDYIARRFGG